MRVSVGAGLAALLLGAAGIALMAGRRKPEVRT
jgi:hypothetical protein